ncbi:DUF438 domain-containing protein [Thermosipho atlanticus]|uniref:PAC domain-containing protein n=1 Tax=Thermosipho atlanticus DSM 15807 TaxID=1123380 RepID=A0A1M5T0Y8_9BACT|nr:DUF438 domain-containing protein [Thermosipho atlanticus]SHH44451.1 hypothetical protein SAMN02745199_1109 [Thermosipho atlanticus DSM 15807]
MSEVFNKKEYLKNLIKRTKTEDNEKLKEEIKKMLSEVSPIEIALIEQELIQEEGLTVEQVRNVCNIHIDVLKDKTRGPDLNVPEWHPIHILVKEHDHFQNTVVSFKSLVDKIIEKNSFSEALPLIIKIQEFIDTFEKLEHYFQKEENVLFPILEKHGIEKPPMVMWKEHDIFRELRKKLKLLKENRNNDFDSFKDQLWQISTGMLDLILNHIHKEHFVLFPAALQTITEEEWKIIREEFDKIGYCCYVPQPMPDEIAKDKNEVTLEQIASLINKYAEKSKTNEIEFPSGILTKKQLTFILNTLPVDITFVDKNDEVKYFNETKDRIFVRSRTIIGRKVQNCHPEKSIEIVNRILDDFKNGKRDRADFWLKLGDKYVLIQYFAVRDEKGDYLGTLEVTMDIAPIQKITGEKRIYDD